jgi:phosphoribosyl 1,2-cyclic phosphodiesterase
MITDMNKLSGAKMIPFTDKFDMEKIDGIGTPGEVTAIKTSHDCAGPTALRFDFEASKSVTFLTDSGVVTDDFAKAFSSETVVLESNYDPVMLKYGTYTPSIKARIAGSQGHLSNRQSSEFAALLLKSGTKNILLAHLSKQNNTPEDAKRAFLQATAEYKEGRDYFVKVLAPVCEPWFLAV